MITVFRETKKAIRETHNTINQHGWVVGKTSENPLVRLFCLKRLSFNLEENKDKLLTLFNECLKNGSIVKVAQVDTDSLDTAYEATNTISQHWSMNTSVTMTDESKEAFLSSTSMGDLLQTEDGKMHFVCDFGFCEV